MSIPFRGPKRRNHSQSLQCTLPKEILAIAFPIEMHVLFSFLHLGSLHPPSSHFLSSCAFQRDPSSTPYIDYVDGANCFSMNLVSTAWASFTPLHSLVHSNSVCIGSVTKKQAEYDVVIGLLADALDHRIIHLHVCLDSLIFVMQLNGIYHVCKYFLFKKKPMS